MPRSILPALFVFLAVLACAARAGWADESAQLDKDAWKVRAGWVATQTQAQTPKPPPNLCPCDQVKGERQEVDELERRRSRDHFFLHWRSIRRPTHFRAFWFDDLPKPAVARPHPAVLRPTADMPRTTRYQPDRHSVRTSESSASAVLSRPSVSPASSMPSASSELGQSMAPSRRMTVRIHVLSEANAETATTGAVPTTGAVLKVLPGLDRPRQTRWQKSMLRFR